MIRTYHNFKQWINRHYPDITVIPIYGTGAYTLSKPLSPEDMYVYNVQQLPNGTYIVFPGLEASQVMEMYQSIVKHGMPKRPERGVPTTFSAFETWVTKHGLKPLHRTHITGISAAEALHDDSLEHVKRNWYMYEFSLDPVSGASELFKEAPRAPHVYTESGSITLLIKTSGSTYVSKKQLFLRKFASMQPLYEQAVAACATEDWDKAAELLANYASIQFEKDVCVSDISKMKEAYENGILNLFARCFENFTVETGDTTF